MALAKGLGLGVLKPFGESGRYDVAVENGGPFWRVRGSKVKIPTLSGKERGLGWGTRSICRRLRGALRLRSGAGSRHIVQNRRVKTWTDRSVRPTRASSGCGIRRPGPFFRRGCSGRGHGRAPRQAGRLRCRDR
jgi:hypothetical protein